MSALTQQLEQLRKKMEMLEQWNAHLTKASKEVEQQLELALAGTYDPCAPLGSIYSRIASMATEHQAFIRLYGSPRRV